MPLMIDIVAVPSLCNSSKKRYEPMLLNGDMPKHCDERKQNKTITIWPVLGC